MTITAADHTAATAPRWWLVRARYGDGWRARLLDASMKVVPVPAGAAGDLPDFVVVNAVDRAGVESPAVRVIAGSG